MGGRAVAPAPRSAEPGKAHRIQRDSLKLSQPHDAAEREASRVARHVMTMPGPAAAPRERVSLLAARAPSGGTVPANPPPPPEDLVSPELTHSIRGELGKGAALPVDTRNFMEPRFRANFAGVRVHTDQKAANLATRLGARAFTYGRDIFFNTGAFAPDSPEGMELIAHELTHTIQQREAVQREVAAAAPPVVQERAGPQVQRGIISRALDWIADKANYIPGYRLLTIIIGRNPINMERVERSGENILRALIEFIPGGHAIVEALENHGVMQKGGKFIEDTFAALGDLGAAIRDALMDFIDSLGWRDIFHLGDLWGPRQAHLHHARRQGDRARQDDRHGHRHAGQGGDPQAARPLGRRAYPALGPARRRVRQEPDFRRGREPGLYADRRLHEPDRSERSLGEYQEGQCHRQGLAMVSGRAQGCSVPGPLDPRARHGDAAFPHHLGHRHAGRRVRQDRRRLRQLRR